MAKTTTQLDVEIAEALAASEGRPMRRGGRRILHVFRRVEPGRYYVEAGSHAWHVVRVRSDYGDFQWIIDRDDQAPFAQCDTLDCVRATIINAVRDEQLGGSAHHATKRAVPAADALRASEYAKRLTDAAYSAEEHRAAAKAHERAAKLHKSDPTGVEAAWGHGLAASQHRQVAKARTAERKVDAPKALQKTKTWAAYQEKLAAVRDHTAMAEEYARQALAAAKKR